MKIKTVIDRIENAFAVIEIEGELTVDFPVKFLPAQIKEGDQLTFNIKKLPENREFI